MITCVLGVVFAIAGLALLRYVAVIGLVLAVFGVVAIAEAIAVSLGLIGLPGARDEHEGRR